MPAPDSRVALQELVTRGRLAPSPLPALLAGGNVDRRDAKARTSWRAPLPDGKMARIVVGSELAGVARRQAAFAQASPTLVPEVLFHESLATAEAMADRYFAGVALESLATGDPARARPALAQVVSALARTAEPSTELARQAEWREWTQWIGSQAFWTDAERRDLQTQVWPALYPCLAADSPTTRWSNGDFTASNILVNATGDVRLIDCEFAARTHFFPEDSVRFSILSQAAREEPELFASVLPPVGLAWHLFFWLRQAALEYEQNTAAYFAQVVAVRRAVIRRVAEHVLGVTLRGWSVEAQPLFSQLETLRWDNENPAALRLAGWCHVPGAPVRHVALRQGDRPPVFVRPGERPDVQAHFAGATPALLSGLSGVFPLVSRKDPVALAAVTADGTWLPLPLLGLAAVPGRGPWLADYPQWATLYDPDPPLVDLPGEGPLFSILLPVFNTPPDLLRACVDSVRRQHYPRWELRVVDDGSTSDLTAAALTGLAPDARIHVQRQPANSGISRATNAALAAATGEFIVLLDHDDLLRPHTLAEFARRLAAEPTLDAVYTDEDKIDPAGQRLVPFLKPAFSPEFLLGVMYIGHALCVRTAVARATGGFDPAFDGIQDYEFFLRVTERTDRIGHIPRILYHWRQSAQSSALHGNVKGDMDARHVAAVEAHLRRRQRSERVVPLGGHRLRLQSTVFPSHDVVRPTVGESALDALRRAARASTAEILVLDGGGATPLAGDQATALAAAAALPDSGLCAPLLISRDGWVIESGRTVSPAGIVPVMRGFDPDGDGYNGSLPCRREVALVAPECCAIRRERVGAAPKATDWNAWGDELRETGLRHRVCPEVRVRLDAEWDRPAAIGSPFATTDPCFNPHFDPRCADFSLAWPPAHLVPVAWHLETNLADAASDGCVIARGWAFLPDGQPVPALRLCAAGRTFDAVTGLPRLDVARNRPEHPADNCGFEIRGTLPSGGIAVQLEARLPSGRWLTLHRDHLDVGRRIRPLWLGGGSWRELMFTQVPLHAAYAPRRLVPETFPALAASPSRPRLAIVTPSYQQARFLEETIRGVVEQAGVSCDYVIQDGGSTDGSPEIIRRHASRLRAWESAPDGGQAAAILAGFAKTEGKDDDVMAWINSDDFYLPGALGFVTDYFARNPAVDVIYGHRIVVDDASREIARWHLPRHDRQVLELNDFVPQETLFWRRRIWNRAGGLDPTLRFALDWDLLLRFQAAGATFARVPYFLGCFRIHSAQKTSAQMQSIGQAEIDRLRTRAQGRTLSPAEIEQHPALHRYLRRSAWIAFLARLGIRAP
jgi:glycosyltransferase involved in cell wall biosynthesis